MSGWMQVGIAIAIALIVAGVTGWLAGRRTNKSFVLPVELEQPDPFKGAQPPRSGEEAQWRNHIIDRAWDRYYAVLDEQTRRIHEWSVRYFESTLSSGASALKALTLLNGASSIAILSLIGVIINGPSNAERMIYLTRGIAWFVAGVGIAVLASVMMYFVQTLASAVHTSIWGRQEHHARRLHAVASGMQVATVFLSVFSFLFFVAGVAVSLVALAD